jgi:hypothetical protein
MKDLDDLIGKAEPLTRLHTETLHAIARAQAAFPYQRTLQIISNAFATPAGRENDFFNVREETLVAALEDYIKKYAGKIE